MCALEGGNEEEIQEAFKNALPQTVRRSSRFDQARAQAADSPFSRQVTITSKLRAERRRGAFCSNRYWRKPCAEIGASPLLKIRQSIVRWTYQQMPLDKLCEVAAEIGYCGIDVLAPRSSYSRRAMGWRCTMGFAGIETTKQLESTRTEYHDQFEQSLRRFARSPSSMKSRMSSHYVATVARSVG